MATSKKTTVNLEEIDKFNKIAEEWWDENGKFKPLHQLNPCRIKYIKEKLVTHFNKDSGSITPLKDITMLDIGCGGGLLTEPMARLGANITGIDAGEKNIKAAIAHAANMDLKINYLNTTSSELLKQKKRYDVVLAMEIIEHVADVELFVKECTSLLNNNGLIFISTLNKTIKSYLFAILGAEYILKILPKGTHDFKKFLKPSQVYSLLEANNVTPIEMTGMNFNPLNQEWSLSKNLDVNYIIVAKKP